MEAVAFYTIDEPANKSTFVGIDKSHNMNLETKIDTVHLSASISSWNGIFVPYINLKNFGIFLKGENVNKQYDELLY